jgi:hypothetical protein
MPAERQPEIQLRKWKESFQQRVGDRQRRPDESQLQGQAIQLQRQDAGDAKQQHEYGQGLVGPHHPGCQWAGLSATHVWVDVAVEQIIDDAARAAHHERAGGEDRQQPPWRMAGRGDPQCPQFGPEQQPDADGTVQAHQPGDIAQPAHGA